MVSCVCVERRWREGGPPLIHWTRGNDRTFIVCKAACVVREDGGFVASRTE